MRNHHVKTQVQDETHFLKELIDLYNNSSLTSHNNEQSSLISYNNKQSRVAFYNNKQLSLTINTIVLKYYNTYKNENVLCYYLIKDKKEKKCVLN